MIKFKPIHGYVALVFILGLVGLAVLDWSATAALATEDIVGLAALTGLGLLSESLALRIRFGDTTGNSSITFLPLLACVIVFGPGAAGLFIGLTGVVAEFIIRRKERIKALFNVGQYLLAASLAGMSFSALGGQAQVLNTPSVGFSLQILPFAAFGVVFLLANQLSVSLAVALHQGVPIRTVVLRMLGTSSGAAIVYDLAITPIAVAVAFLYMELGVPGLLVLILPLLFIRHSYLIYYKLLESNRNLLSALVKAIETRDPYTSGHSVRVAELARDIGETLGLPKQRTDQIETAALLHDIGKIDRVFSTILCKSGSLNSAERRIIESHVTRGVAILASVSSFSSEILESVLHHHERIDGTGYPTGLRGENIPLGARIIGVCDAIDAMLSNRPYRDALSISAVAQQLVAGQGAQFDSVVVQAILDCKLLEPHSGRVAAGDIDHRRDVFEVTMPRQPRSWGRHKREDVGSSAALSISRES